MGPIIIFFSRHYDASIMKIGLLDPALYRGGGEYSPNVGDLIISRAVQRELLEIFGSSTEIIRVPTHEFPTARTLSALKKAELTFVGGSNLLYFTWWRPALWKIGPFGVLGYRNLILFGVGWGAYGISPNSYGRWLCSLVLDPRAAHSVRDGYTRQLADQGLRISKVMNTTCPTMWRLTPDHVRSIRRTKGQECIFALTHYRIGRDPVHDLQLIRDLQDRYRGRLLLWPQAPGDLDYARSLGYSGKVIERSLESLLSLLGSGVEFDYVGTRLHAGVLCLEHGVRSLIISIDNRAREIGSDTGLPTVARQDRSKLLEWTEGGGAVEIRLPQQAIDEWRAQFSGNR